ncbi:serine/threonine-protein kinase Nek8-like isoform X2 [Sycon ciliatum]|uniref:serine/threonine-protein kinase Nek8-like isoform X2 n=1 Tax=Sycon ciliatum TaxID=27933 RepID=UPI0031F60F67
MAVCVVCCVCIRVCVCMCAHACPYIHCVYLYLGHRHSVLPFTGTLRREDACRYNQKSDVWALGCILYELASRNRAFEAPSLPALVMKIMRGTFAPISSHYSEDLRRLILNMLHTDPRQRPSTQEVLAQPICMKTFFGLQCSLGLLPLSLGPRMLSSRSRGSMSNHAESAAAAANGEGSKAASSGATAGAGGAVSGSGRKKGEVLMWGGGYTKPTSMKFVAEDGSTASRVALGRAQRLVLTTTGKVLSLQTSKAGSEYLMPGSRGSKSHADGRGGGQASGADGLASASWCHIEGLERVTSTQMSCGDLFTAILTNRGILMTFGSGVHGALGHGNYEDIAKPRIVESLVTQSVELVSCGTSHMAAATGSGDVYTWGECNHGCLGTGSLEASPRPRLAKQLGSGRPRALHCGVDCTLLVDARGQLHVCGNNRHNKIALDGSGEMLEGTPSFTAIPLSYFNGQRLNSISSGLVHSIMLTESGACFTVGANTSGQLGYDLQADDAKRPQPVTVLSPHWIKHVSCGDQFTVAATKDKIFVWGKGRRGRLASAADNDLCSPTEVNLNDGTGRKYTVTSLQASHGATMVSLTTE